MFLTEKSEEHHSVSFLSRCFVFTSFGRGSVLTAVCLSVLCLLADYLKKLWLDFRENWEVGNGQRRSD